MILAISGDYSRPVTVNGFSCKNCTDVDNAKRHIDPSRPDDGPYGVNAKPSNGLGNQASVKFGGALASLNDLAPSQADRAGPKPVLDIRV
jgi:hypothetical protein